MDSIQIVILSVVPFVLGFFIAWVIWGKYRDKVSGMSQEIRQLKLSIDQLKKKVEDETLGFLEREGQLALLRGQVREKEVQILKLQGQVQINEIVESGKFSTEKVEHMDLTAKSDATGISSEKREGRKIEGSSTPKRRGRPPKVKAEEKATKSVAKSGRGRPKKDSKVEVEKVKPKRRGRPPKVKAEEKATKSVAKSGQGRPKKDSKAEAETAKSKRRGRPPKSYDKG